MNFLLVISKEKEKKGRKKKSFKSKTEMRKPAYTIGEGVTQYFHA
jgi:hypothetical protein